MTSVEAIADEIIAREGGFVNDRDDPGGATNYGVTVGTMRRLGLDLDGDGDVDVQDVRRLTKAQARQIFVDHYFHGPGIAKLPEALQASVFDMYVNAGANAVRVLQRLLVEMGQRIAVDGGIGPQTIEAARIAEASAPQHLRDAYGIARRNYYYRLAEPADCLTQVRAAAGRRQGRLDHASRDVYQPALPSDHCRAYREGGAMGVIDGLFSLIFGNGRNLVKETAEVFRENAEAGAVREHDLQGAVLQQFAAEFAHPSKGLFDRFMDALNRVPRPALALGTLGLFVAAMYDPIWFASRMQGVALVPEPLWWLLGAIVSFYFGARHQAKGQDFQRSIADTMIRVPGVRDNIASLEALNAGSGTPASDAIIDANPALDDWRQAS